MRSLKQRKNKQSLPWRPHASDLNEDNAIIPNLVYNMLAWILTDVCKDTEPI